MVFKDISFTYKVQDQEVVFLMKKRRGVQIRFTKNGKPSFRSSFTFRRKHISLGSFDTEKEASLAYETALALINNQNLTVDDYEESESSLAFDKWISILNFRDNGLYIRTPIYLKKSFFFYYLSPTEILKFDVEDLFYYSNHKIQKRGGHLFLSDYGMQVSLTSRYGIKSFAVAGKDYVFLNGDTLDFRYSNIKIINRYFGVSRERDFPKPSFLAKINIHGSIIIGRYEDEKMAAIAYNKAVSLLKEVGFPKHYEENYIEGEDSCSVEEIKRKLPLNKGLLKIISSLKDSKDIPQ